MLSDPASRIETILDQVVREQTNKIMLPEIFPFVCRNCTQSRTEILVISEFFEEWGTYNFPVVSVKIKVRHKLPLYNKESEE